MLRRATGESLDARFAHLAGAAGWDLHLRVRDRDLHRVATLVEATERWRADYLEDPRWGPALGRPSGLLDPAVLSSDRFRRTPFPAVALHATALALASFYDDVARPGGLVATRLGHDLWRAYVEPAATGHDLVLDRDVTWTLGFQVAEEDGRVELGMGGAGGCSAWTEPAAGIGAAFVTRGLGTHDRGEVVWQAIAAAYPPPRSRSLLSRTTAAGAAAPGAPARSARARGGRRTGGSARSWRRRRRRSGRAGVRASPGPSACPSASENASRHQLTW